MKYVSISIILLAFSMTLKSQYSITTLKFAESQHDFGVFKEEAGRQTFDFVVTNTGSQPLVIQKVTASCGCTTPEWTRWPISPGGKGKVTAIYDPANLPGTFNKTLTVYSNTKPQTTVLTIKGEVLAREKTVEELYTFPVGTVRFESTLIPFGNVKKSEVKTTEMKIINPSRSGVKVEFDILPPYLNLVAEPVTLKPGQKGRIIGTFDATKNSGWGTVSDLIKIKLNGVTQENAYCYVSANLVEDFSSLSKEDLANAPVLIFNSKTFNLGKIKSSAQNNVEFKFTNEGGRDLIIRNIKAACGCTAVQEGTQGVGIKPGESGSIKAVFNSGGFKGNVTKAIYVYSNDPKNSETILMLNADVD
jgi:hypothetical protein